MDSTRIIKFCIVVFLSLGTMTFKCYAQEAFVEDFQNISKSLNVKDFAGQFLKGSKNGMGILSQKKGIFYVGDFVKNKKSGVGLLFIPKGSLPKGFPEATFFVGKWMDDKLNGRVKCYDEYGCLIYDGEFNDNNPEGDFSQETDYDKKLSRLVADNGDIYIGETFCGYPEGFGFIKFSNGDLWQSKFKDGAPSGVGLLIFHDREWQAMKVGEEGEYVLISSSREYASLDAGREQFVKSSISEAFESFSAAKNIVMNIVEKESGNAEGVSGELSGLEGRGSTASSSGGNYQAIYSNWARRAEMNYKSLTNLGYKIKKDGKNVSGSSGQGSSPSTYTMQMKYLREAQREMKRIRQKAAKNGVNIPKSEYEDVSVSY